MQNLVGIVRNQGDMERALTGLQALKERAQRVRVSGNRQYNSGWHTALALRNMLVVSEAITRAAIERRESRGAHFREDSPTSDPASARFNLAVRKDANGGMQVLEVPIPEMRPDLRQVIEEMK